MTTSTNSPPIQGMTVRHRTRGTLYRVVANATLQTNVLIGDDTAIVIYQGEDGKFWARPVTEFLDGRFENISPTNE